MVPYMRPKVVGQAQERLKLLSVYWKWEIKDLGDLLFTHRYTLFREDTATKFDFREAEFALTRFKKKIMFLET
jgi:hypothetical protein